MNTLERDADSAVKLGKTKGLVGNCKPTLGFPFPEKEAPAIPTNWLTTLNSKLPIWLDVDANGFLGGADPEIDFWYLAGPMSHRPGFNFKEFDRIAGNLRDAGYNVCSPAELDHEKERAAAAASPDGRPDNLEHAKPWTECMRRDITIVAMPECCGVIAMYDWPESSGGRIETQVADWLHKPVNLYRDYDGLGDAEFTLTLIDRDGYYHNYVDHHVAGAAKPEPQRSSCDTHGCAC